MKIKSWFKYLAYILIIFILIFLEWYIINPLLMEGYLRFTTKYYHYLIPIIINVGIGLVLGLEHLFQEIKKVGTWKINLPQIIFMVIPSLYFSLSVLFGFINNQFAKTIFYPVSILIGKGSISFTIIFQLILGFTIITSFYKSNS